MRPVPQPIMVGIMTIAVPMYLSYPILPAIMMPMGMKAAASMDQPKAEPQAVNRVERMMMMTESRPWSFFSMELTMASTALVLPTILNEPRQKST